MSDSANDPLSGYLDSIAGGLADRARTLLLVLDRQDRLETAGEFIGWLAGERAAGRLGAVAREVLLRALRAAGDPLNFAMLYRLDREPALALGELMRDTGLSRVAASERVNDLVQAGLAVRELTGGDVRGTALASGLVAVVEAAAGRAGERLAAQLDAGSGAAGAPPAGGRVSR